MPDMPVMETRTCRDTALHHASAPHQQGVMMMEALVAILIFAIGILGLVASQRSAVQGASEAQYRAIAAAQANDLISRMWLSDRTATTLQASFGSSAAGTGYTSWLTAVKSSGLPNVASYPPSVTFSTVTGGGSSAVSSSLATIKVYWKAPGDTSSQAHYYTALAQLK
jgi:type IV pilus assembly protein PilV